MTPPRPLQTVFIVETCVTFSTLRAEAIKVFSSLDPQQSSQVPNLCLDNHSTPQRPQTMTIRESLNIKKILFGSAFSDIGGSKTAVLTPAYRAKILNPPQAPTEFSRLPHPDVRSSYQKPLKIVQACGFGQLETPSGTVKFKSEVSVIVIPSRREYSAAVKKTLWTGRKELRAQAMRNTLEYRTDGKDDWRECREETEFVFLNGELMHPHTAQQSVASGLFLTFQPKEAPNFYRPQPLKPLRVAMFVVPILLVIWYYSSWGLQHSTRDVDLQPTPEDALRLLCFAVASCLLDNEMKKGLKHKQTN